MASLNGKWAMTSVENLEAYLNATQSPEEFKTKMMTLPEELTKTPNAFVEEIHMDKDAGTIQMVVFIKGEKKYDSGHITIGEETEQKGVDGRLAKITVHCESDTKLTMQKTGTNFHANIIVTLTSGSEMTTRMTCNGVTSTETYKRM